MTGRYRNQTHSLHPRASVREVPTNLQATHCCSYVMPCLHYCRVSRLGQHIQALDRSSLRANLSPINPFA